jgi:hypothetical protein
VGTCDLYVEPWPAAYTYPFSNLIGP